MQKVFIKNRRGQKIAVLVEGQENAKGLVFIAHGLGGFKEQPHMGILAKTFLGNGYTAVRFDATHSIGESDGNYEDATTTNYCEDLEDVIKWASGEEWYQEPFVLVGHSLGAYSTALYAENHPEKVKALAPLSVVVSGKLSWENKPKEELEEWKRSGWKHKISQSKPGLKMSLKWSHMLDRLNHDLLPKADRLTMPVLLIIGENDKTTPLKHHNFLAERIPGPKELHIIEGAEHTFRAAGHLAEIAKVVDAWIKNLV